MRAHGEPPHAIALRPMRATDIDAGLRLCRQSGWNQVQRDWAQFLALSPDGVFAAEHEGQVVGTSATVRHGTRFAWIGMVLVDSAFRGQGIGTRLLDRALTHLSDLPLAGLDATPAGRPLYSARGFVERGVIHRLYCASPALPPPAHGAVRPMTAQDLPGMLALDESVLGASRAPLLQWMRDGAREYAWVASPGDRIAGYALGRHGRLFEHIGPIVAADADTACQLAIAAMSATAGRAVIVDAPGHAHTLREQLGAIGFLEQRSLVRMWRGAGGPPGDPSRQHAILGPEFG